MEYKKSSFLTDEQKEEIIKKHPNKITKEGELIVECEETRSQFKNKEIALLRLCNLINKALKYKKRERRKIKVPKRKKEERLQEKKAISRKKELRSKIIPEEET